MNDFTQLELDHQRAIKKIAINGILGQLAIAALHVAITLGFGLSFSIGSGFVYGLCAAFIFNGAVDIRYANKRIKTLKEVYGDESN